MAILKVDNNIIYIIDSLLSKYDTAKKFKSLINKEVNTNINYIGLTEKPDEVAFIPKIKLDKIIEDGKDPFASQPNTMSITRLVRYLLSLNNIKSDNDDLQKFTNAFKEEYYKKNPNLKKEVNQIINYTNRFFDALLEIDSKLSEKLQGLEKIKLDNKLLIQNVDLSNEEGFIKVRFYKPNSNDTYPVESKLTLSRFIKKYLPEYSEAEAEKFVRRYNYILHKKGLIVKQKAYNAPVGKKIDKIKDFKSNPEDVRYTFLSLVQETYPHGHEEEVLKYLPDLTKDKYGNYYKRIGESITMFTSHLDTVDRKKSVVNLYSMDENGGEIIITDGNTILGADDKAGVAVMLYMMHHNVPGLYYFFIGEERGGIGSRDLAFEYERYTFLKKIKKCVSFDRRNCFSIITDQMGIECCSNEFALGLCKELNKSGLKMSPDPTGVFTDSASFIDLIPECTNVSVGYMAEHTQRESQNITFLDKLAKACIKVDWESLPIARKLNELSEYILHKHRKFIEDFRQTAFNSDFKLIGEGSDKIYLKLSIDDVVVDPIYDDILNISVLLTKYNMNPDILFEDQFILIELK